MSAALLEEIERHFVTCLGEDYPQVQGEAAPRGAEDEQLASTQTYNGGESEAAAAVEEPKGVPALIAILPYVQTASGYAASIDTKTAGVRDVAEIHHVLGFKRFGVSTPQGNFFPYLLASNSGLARQQVFVTTLSPVGTDTQSEWLPFLCREIAKATKGPQPIIVYYTAVDGEGAGARYLAVEEEPRAREIHRIRTEVSALPAGFVGRLSTDTIDRLPRVEDVFDTAHPREFLNNYIIAETAKRSDVERDPDMFESKPKAPGKALRQQKIMAGGPSAILGEYKAPEAAAEAEDTNPAPAAEEQPAAAPAAAAEDSAAPAATSDEQPAEEQLDGTAKPQEESQPTEQTAGEGQPQEGTAEQPIQDGPATTEGQEQQQAAAPEGTTEGNPTESEAPAAAQKPVEAEKEPETEEELVARCKQEATTLLAKAKERATAGQTLVRTAKNHGLTQEEADMMQRQWKLADKKLAMGFIKKDEFVAFGKAVLPMELNDEQLGSLFDALRDPEEDGSLDLDGFLHLYEQLAKQ